MDKNRANELLRYGIEICQGGAFNARRNIRTQNVIELKNRLSSAGFWWQADKLDIWISRLRRGDYDN